MNGPRLAAVSPPGPLTVQQFFTYDVSADGRHVINANPEQKDPRPVDIIMNWTSQLKK